MKTNKKSEIKLRVTEDEKNKLKQLANDNNESLSSYMRRKSLDTSQDLLQTLPQRIDACSFFNEIYHSVSKYGSASLIKEIVELYKKYTRGYGKDD